MSAYLRIERVHIYLGKRTVIIIVEFSMDLRHARKEFERTQDMLLRNTYIQIYGITLIIIIYIFLINLLGIICLHIPNKHIWNDMFSYS